MSVSYKDIVCGSNNIFMNVDGKLITVYQCYNTQLCCEPGNWTNILNTHYNELYNYCIKIKGEIEALQLIESNKVLMRCEENRKRECKLLHDKFG